MRNFYLYEINDENILNASKLGLLFTMQTNWVSCARCDSGGNHQIIKERGYSSITNSNYYDLYVSAV